MVIGLETALLALSDDALERRRHTTGIVHPRVLAYPEQVATAYTTNAGHSLSTKRVL